MDGGTRRQDAVQRLRASAYRIPTDLPEADGTLHWDSTTLVIAELEAGGEKGFGYTYGTAATAAVIEDLLKIVVEGQDPMAIPRIWKAMTRAIRNQGRPGIASMAVAAVDNALWDLKAKLLGLPLVTLLGQFRESIPVYGSGGFTTYTERQLQEQLGGWVEQGISRVKMKIGADAEINLERIRAAREAVGPDAELFVDANSAFSRKQALYFMEASVEHDVCWLEEPLPPEDLEGLRLLCERAPPRLEIADGEYGYDLPYFRRLLAAGAVDVLMADATRCAGITGFLRTAALCEAFSMPMSSHCAPLLHMHLGCAVAPMRHAEYFHDHVRIEEMYFDGMPKPVRGALTPDLSRAGFGVDFKRADVIPFQAYPAAA